MCHESSADKGTLWQLRNLLNRTAVPSIPKANVKAAEDFLTIVFEGYSIAAARAILSYHSTSDVKELAKLIVDSFCTVNRIGMATLPTPTDDRVQAYSKELITLGLIWLGFNDAIKEGDGDRVLTYWKFLMLLFKADGRRNYSCEACKILLDYHYFYTPRQAAQLKWSRFVNTHGQPGRNISADLHLEYLNRRAKEAISNLGSNVTAKAIDRVGKSLGTVNHICTSFENQLVQSDTSQKHADVGQSVDLNEVVTCLEGAQVFNNIAGRRHRAFSFSSSYLELIDTKSTIVWLTDQFRKYAPQ